MSKQIRGRVNDPVFQHTDKSGVYTAQLMGFNVLVEKIGNAYWEVNIADAKDEDGESFLASGATRNDALKEAYYTIMFRESQRLDWILNNQPYRQYEGTHPRRKASLDTPASNDDQHEEPTEVKGKLNARDYKVRDGQIINKNNQRVVTHAKLNKIKDHYFIKQNRNLGGHFWFWKDDKGIVGASGGPFISDDLAFKDILIKEGIIE